MIGVMSLPAPKLSKHPVVLVVSFDGFRYDYLEKDNTPNLIELQRQGITVPHMNAQFPANTFPNHHSIATGLTPDHHGITDNTFYDPLLGKNLSGFNDDWEFWNYSPDVLPFYVSTKLLFSHNEVMMASICPFFCVVSNLNFLITLDFWHIH